MSGTLNYRAKHFLGDKMRISESLPGLSLPPGNVISVSYTLSTPTGRVDFVLRSQFERGMISINILDILLVPAIEKRVKIRTKLNRRSQFLFTYRLYPKGQAKY